MIVVNKNLILSKEGITVPCTATIVPTSFPVQGFSVIVYHDQYQDPRIEEPEAAATAVEEFHQHVKTMMENISTAHKESQSVKSWYQNAYNLWAVYRRKHRHAMLVMVHPCNKVLVVDIDNLYLDKQTFTALQPVWKYGVDMYDITQVSTFALPEITGWKTIPWTF